MLTISIARWCPVFLLTLLLPTTGMAMTCKTQGSGDAVIRGDLGSTVAIADKLPDGTIVWRSERLSVAVECASEGPTSTGEEVFVYLNPENLKIGEGIRAGLTLSGTDYVQANGRIATQQQVPACSETESSGAGCPKVRFNLPFSVFIEKFGPTPSSGVASDLLNYRMFQLDSGKGINPIPDNNLNYVINSLTSLRFIACAAELRVMPETVDFGQVGISNVHVGEVAASERFTLATSRICDSPFSLNARLTPVSGRLLGDVLVPMNNDSIGIRIERVRGNVGVPYNEVFHLTDMLGEEDYSATADFNAILLWQTNAPEPGPFSAEVMVDLFYK